MYTHVHIDFEENLTIYIQSTVQIHLHNKTTFIK